MPWTAAYQASPSMGLSRQKHWSGLPFPSPMHESGKWKWRPHYLRVIGAVALLASEALKIINGGNLTLLTSHDVSQRRQWHPTPVLLPWKSHGRRSLDAAVHGVAKSRARLSDFTFTFPFHALEKEMATHSSVLAWRIPGTGEPGGLPSMGLHSWTRLKWLSSSSSMMWVDS